jgi:hypothetical protein
MTLPAIPLGFGAALEMRALLEYLVYAGAIILATVLITLWIITLRQPTLKSTQRQRRQHSPRRGLWARLKGGEDSSTSGKRRKRRSHRRRGPTLAETGGLPPIRNQPPSSSGPSQP